MSTSPIRIPEEDIVLLIRNPHVSGSLGHLLSVIGDEGGLIGNIETQFILGLAPELDLSTFLIPNWIKVENKYPQKALECADFSLVASGSATLEAAVFGTPMVIVYKMSLLSWLLSKLLVRTEYAGMVNIIAGKKIIPEYIQNEATIQAISKECLNIINDKAGRRMPAPRTRMHQKCKNAFIKLN